MNRIAGALADDTEHYQALRAILLDQRFLPGGRVQAAMGSTKNVTPYNCFVSGTIEDSFVEGNGSIMARAKEAAATMRMGGGIGYDFSHLRPNGDNISKLQSQSSGPVSFMEIFDAVCRCIASSGHRRGAQMGVLRVDHPDIEEFIHAKRNEDRLNGFNISVGVTDEFMQALLEDKPFKLWFNGKTYREINPRTLWDTLMRSTWDWAEPGVLFIDRINEMNNLWYCEEIAAVNPCGEQPLPPHGACLLGSFNLPKYMVQVDGKWMFDYLLFQEDIPIVVRAMDNVVDRASYPLYEQEKEAKAKRRMGLGVTGLANALEAMELSYGSKGFVGEMNTVLGTLVEQAYLTSAFLARAKGTFPEYDDAAYLGSPFVQSLPAGVQDAIRAYGMRNSHLTSIAPTGTISMTADNVSSGIEPVFSYSQERIVQTRDGAKTVQLEDYGYRVFGVEGKKAEDVTIDEHLAVLATATRWMDSAVSKTCNVPNDMSWEEFKKVYIRAWQMGCKGITTFRMGGLRAPILKSDEGNQDPPASCYVDTETGRRECE